MNETTVLYALSTLAQTCAALAAFVGAVGVFRLQTIRDQRRDAEREMRGPTFYLVGPGAAEILPLQTLQAEVEARAASNPGLHSYAQAYHRARKQWLRYPPIYGRSRRWLVIFEGWNLAVILVSLVGFSYVKWLASSPAFTFWALLVIALGTVGVTGWSVVVWTSEGRWFSQTLRNMWNRLRGRTAP